MKRETIGKISSDLIIKAPETFDPIELEREMHKEYDMNFVACIQSSKKVFPGNFYVVVITKKEPLMQNVIRNYFFGRNTCPAPDYDQTVYSYDARKEEFKFLWVIPSKDACLYLKDNALQVAPEERDLLKFVLDFADGTLYTLCRQLNGEEPVPKAD